MMLDREDMTRYSRQISLSEIGVSGQLQLKNASVLCIGAGGLGSPLLQYLAAAGIGRIGIIDHDEVELSNLPRQVLYQQLDVGSKKVEAAKNYLQRANPRTLIDIFPERFTVKNAAELISQYDIVADCTDQLLNRYLVNEVCVALNKPFVFAGISKFQGQLMLFHGRTGPCFCCLFPFNPASNAAPDCNAAGVLGVLPGILGSMQASLIIQAITQHHAAEVGQFYTFDLHDFTLRHYKISQQSDCQTCHAGLSLDNYTHDVAFISVAQLREKIALHERFILLDVRSAEEFQAGNMGGICIPLQELSQRWSELPIDTRVIICCKSGVRSLAAARILQANHFRSVYCLEGGSAI
jgi:molybdopterin/thiamine biosynthesis adenylyltransferase/rhodanese-related sulfurtransferase